MQHSEHECTVAITTDQVIRSGITDGETNPFVEVDETDETTEYYAYPAVHRETGVSTSATTIFDMALITPSGSQTGGAVLVVVGIETANDNSRFNDILHIDRVSSPVSRHSIERDTPDARTYSRSGTDIQVAMDSNTYNVIATGTWGLTQI